LKNLFIVEIPLVSLIEGFGIVLLIILNIKAGKYGIDETRFIVVNYIFN
jgi:hypothetical protein